MLRRWRASEALELTRSGCDLNSLSETPTDLSWQSRDAQISNYGREMPQLARDLLAVFEIVLPTSLLVPAPVRTSTRDQ